MRAFILGLLLVGSMLMASCQHQKSINGKLTSDALDLDGEPTQLLVLGTGHISQWPELERSWLDPLNAKLLEWQPDMILIERLPGWQVQTFVDQPDRFQTILNRTHGDWIDISLQAQTLLGIDLDAANKQLRERLKSETIPTDIRQEISLLFLATYDIENARLHWSYLDPEDRRSSSIVPDNIVDSLNMGLEAKNETMWIAAYLAKQLGHTRLYAFDDQIDKAALNGEEVMSRMFANGSLETVMDDPRLDRLQQSKTRRPKVNDGILDWYLFLNSDLYGKTDIAGQWESFLSAESDGLGRHRVAIWEARNLRMAANAREHIALKPGSRTLIIVGAAHKPWLDAYFDLMSDVEIIHLKDIQ